MTCEDPLASGYPTAVQLSRRSNMSFQITPPLELFLATFEKIEKMLELTKMFLCSQKILVFKLQQLKIILKNMGCFPVNNA